MGLSLTLPFPPPPLHDQIASGCVSISVPEEQTNVIRRRALISSNVPVNYEQERSVGTNTTILLELEECAFGHNSRMKLSIDLR